MDARECAYQVLCKVMIAQGYASLFMRSFLKDLCESDKKMVSEIVYGTLRNHRLVRYQWESYPSKKCDKRLAIVLDMAAYQYYFMEKPAYAVLNEMVSLVKKPERGFINAILRKMVEEPLRIPDNLGIRYSQPDWLVNMWKAHYGEETCEKMLVALNELPITFGRLNTLKVNKDELQGVTFLDDIGFIYEGNLVNTEWFKEGKVAIQDYSSQQVVKHLGVKPWLRVLDCCSAPGTKATQMAIQMKNQGEIICIELHEARKQLIEQAAQKYGIDIIKAYQGDATQLETMKLGLFDRILVDAPCSGLGVLQRKPDIRLKVTPESIDEIVDLQKKILESAAKCLKVNGWMVYSTCTLNKKENERQVKRFLDNHTNFELVEERSIFPYEYHSDGFYYAKIRRIA